MCLKPDDMQDVSDCLNVGALRFAPITLSTSLQMTLSVAEWSCIELLWSRLVPDALFAAFKTQNWKNDFFYIWLCRDDSRSASCEQMCCCSGSYSLTDQSHHHKLINQHEPFRAPGAPGPRGLGASGPPGRCLGCLVAVEMWSFGAYWAYRCTQERKISVQQHLRRFSGCFIIFVTVLSHHLEELQRIQAESCWRPHEGADFSFFNLRQTQSTWSCC